MRSKYNARLAIIYACLTGILLNTTKQVAAQNSSVADMGYEYLLVATHEIPGSGKSWMCRDHALIQEKIPDKISFDKRRKEILQQYAGNSSFSTNVRLINPNQAIIAYEYEKKEAGWDCSKKVITIKIGKDLESCKNQIEKDLVNSPKQYSSSPKIVFQRNATKFASMSCKDMVRFRDTILPKMLNAQVKKYKIQEEHIQYLNKLRVDLESETARGTSNWNILALTVKFGVNTIEDAIGLASPQGYLMNLAKESGVKAVNKVIFLEKVKKGTDALEIMTSENADEALANHLVDVIGNLAPPVKLLKRMNENLNLQADFTEVCKEVKTQLSAIQKAMTAYNAKLAMSKKNLESINNYKDYINAYLLENCK
jgi:hypothetical protein